MSTQDSMRQTLLRSFALRLFQVMLLVMVITFFASSAWSLPWDTDLFKQQSMKSNEMARAPVPGTVPMGARPAMPETAEQAEKDLRNPTSLSADSVWRGQRLWNANCFACHGKVGDGAGPVGKQMTVPSLLTDFYRQRSDQRIFYTIYNGGANMPRYGYKFSVLDHWDIVNYLRFLQGQEVKGMARPGASSNVNQNSQGTQ